MLIFKIIGWIGAVVFVVTYLLLSIKKISSNKVTYHFLNALGGLCLTINSFSLSDNPTLFVNFIWMCIAIYSILNIVVIERKKEV